MKTSRLLLSAVSIMAFALTGIIHASTFDLALGMPRLQSLQTVIPVGSNTVPVALTLLYNTKGQISCRTDSTLDGASLTCVGSTTRRGASVSYAFTLKSVSTPRATVTLRGVLGGTAAATYAGPKGRAKIAAQPVTIVSVAPAPATVELTSSVSQKGQVTGTGNVSAYGTNASVAGKLRGSVTATKLSWTLTQSPRSLSFKGVKSNDVYVGSLKVTIPPDRETIQSFAVPASAFAQSSGIATFRGAVLAGANSLPSAAVGVSVIVKTDLNGDGRFTGAESASVVTDADGRYQATLGVSLQRAVVLEISQEGFAKHLAAFPNVTPGSVVVRNATLQPLTALTLDNGTAQASDGRILLEGLPDNIRGVEARVFNPVTETAQFPGAFADDQNNLLVSSVFSAIEARDANGNVVTSLGANTTLCMEVPRETWSTMDDLTPGSGQIDIPLYYFDETTGEWKRNGANGWLEDATRAKIPEAQLAAIRSGSFSGRVFGAGPITHLSYWNIDWPISTHACLNATIVNGQDQPVAGATVTVKGVTYTGSTSPETTGGDGRVCAEIMRSETAGEDVDRDNVTGETQRVQVTVQFGTNTYSFGPYDSPQSQGACASGGCIDLGLLRLIEANRVIPTLCTITGRLVYSGTATIGTSPLNAGAPIEGATVLGFDPDDIDSFSDCLSSGACGFGTTDANGNFSFSTVVLSGANIFASKAGNSSQGVEYFFGQATTTGCPSTPVTLQAAFSGFRLLTFALVGAGVADGSFSVGNSVATVSFTQNDVTYVGVSTNQVSEPTSVGAWLTLNLINGTSGGQAGTMTFTVNSLTPLQGTWTTSTLGLSGTFAEEIAGE